MKKIEAYIRPSSLTVYHKALIDAGAKGITVWQTKGIGATYHEDNKTVVFRGTEVKKNYIDRVRVEIVVEDDNLENIIACLKETAKNPSSGTLQVFVIPVLESFRIPSE